MPKSSNQKLKLIYLMKILLERTDETHSITMIEKRIETQAIKHMYLNTERSLRSILEKMENNPSENEVNEKIADMIKKFKMEI